MNIPYIEFLFRPLRSELPHYEFLDNYIDDILPKLVPYSEDLYEEEFYTEIPWREVRDDNSLSVILHIFKKKDQPHEIAEKSDAEGPNYLLSIDGNVMQGNWARFPKKADNLITIRTTKNYELFEKSFIHEDFFILKKHGDKWQEGNRKYLVMGREGHIKDLEWREVVELLYEIHRYRDRIIIFVFFAIIVFAVVIYSFY